MQEDRRGGFDSPASIVIMFGIFGLFVVTFGFGISFLNDEAGYDLNSTTVYFDNLSGRLLAGDKSFSSQGEDLEGVLVNPPGSENQVSDTGILTRALNAVLSFGKTYSLTVTTMEQTGALFGIDTVYITVVLTMLVAVFVVATFAWYRGSG